jgi:hypothetical protein
MRRNLLDVGGTIWLGSATFLARRIDLEYVDGDDHRGIVRLDFHGCLNGTFGALLAQ